jgi:hypothetical protein
MLVIAMPLWFQSSIDARTEAHTENFAGVSTGSGVYSANVTLSQDIFDNTVLSVTSVSSNITGDAPTAATYNSVSNVLNVSGLTAGSTRTLSIGYDMESPFIPAGSAVFFTLSNWFYIFAIVGMVIGAIYAFFN